MARIPAPDRAIGEAELRSLETSLLRALCLTINTAGSERKYKILESLSADDFYFPHHSAVFHSLQVMHRRGDYVVFANLDGELRQSDVAVPSEFDLESLFHGATPKSDEVGKLVVRLKERSRSGLKPISDEQVAKIRSAATERTQGDEMSNEKQSRAKASLDEEIEISLEVDDPLQTASIAQIPLDDEQDDEQIEIHLDNDLSSPSVDPRAVQSADPLPKKTAPAAAKPDVRGRGKPSPANEQLLVSESEDWSTYMDEVASKQGKRFETGFRRLDERLEGLTPGLLLIVDADKDRRIDFLKQLTDQMASTDRLRCLFIASETTRATLRLRTLSRLSAVPADDIEKGRLRKESVEWQRVEQQGRNAAHWLKRLFVHEAPGGVRAEQIKRMVDKMVEGPAELTPMVVLDTVDRPNVPAGQRLKALKQLSELTDAVVVAATGDGSLISAPGIDIAAMFQFDNGQLELQVLPAGGSEPILDKFDYLREVCLFKEKT